MNCKLCLFYILFVVSRLGKSSARSPPEPEETGNPIGGDDITFLSPEDFETGELVKSTDVGYVDNDPIEETGKFEGDIDLGGLPYEAYVDKVIDDSPYKTEKEVEANAVRDKWLHWSDAEIPYEIVASNFTKQEKGIIATAIADYNKHTCIRWVPRQSHHENFVRFIAGRGCYSAIGRTGGMQTLSLGRRCVTKGITMHEMMHAAGFFHEQARDDRNDYVVIVWENIQPWARGNFKRMSLEVIDHLNTTYDYDSLMHYGKNYFSRNGKSTILVKESGAKIGQRGGFSDTDIEKLNKLYKCLDERKPVVAPRPPPGSKVCADDNDHCAAWAKAGYCSDNTYTKLHCKRACKLCESEKECDDTKRYCQFWQQEGHCTNDFAKFMTRYCPRACGKC